MVKNEQGDSSGNRRVVPDSTEVKRTEQALKASEKRLQTILDAEPEWVKVIDASGILVEINATGLVMIEADDKSQIIGQSIYPIIAPKYRDSFVALTQRVYQGESSILQFEIIGLKGTRRWLETHAVPLRDEENTIIGLLGITRDITQQKQLLEALRKNGERLRLALDAAQMGIWDWNIQTNYLILSRRQEQLFGLEIGTFEVTYEAFTACIHPEDLAAFNHTLNRTLLEQQDYQAKFRVVWSDGSIHWIEAKGKFFYDETGQAVRMLGTCVDISDKVLAEAQLRQAYQMANFAKNQLNGIIEGTTDLIAALDKEFRFIAFNSAYKQECKRILGKDIELGMSLIDMLAHLPSDQTKAVEYWTRAMQGERYTVLQELGDENLERNYYETTYSPINDENNVQIGACHVVRNVTERVLAQTALQNAKDELELKVKERTQELSHAKTQLECELIEHKLTQRYLQEKVQLLDLAHDAIVTLDLNSTITFWNRGAQVMYGFSKAEAWGKEIDTLLQTQYLKPLSEIEAELFLQGSWEGELTQRKQDGTRIVVSSRWAVQRDLRGRPIAILNINRDITEHKHAEEALQRSEARHRALLNAIPDMMISLSREGIYLDCKPAKPFDLLRPKPELLGKSVYEVLPPDVAQQRMYYVEQAFLTGETQRYEYQWQLQGCLRDIEARVVVSGEHEVLIVGRDMSDVYDELRLRQQAERALRESEARLQAILDKAPAVIYLKDLQCRHLLINHEFERILHNTKEHILGKTAQELFEEGIAAKIQANDTAVLSSGSAIEFEEDIPQEDGIHTYISVKFPLCDADGNPYALCGISTDITQRQQAQARLRRERDLLNGIMQTSVAAITVMDSQGSIVFANDRATQVLGLSKSEITQLSYNAPEWKITDFEGNSFPEEQLPFRQVMVTGKPVFDVRHAIEWPDGKRRYLSINGAPVKELPEAITGVVVSVTDITESKQAEDALRRSEAQLREKATILKQTLDQLQQAQTQLIQAEKMASLGQLVAGIAHEINNPVNFIYGNISCTEDYLHDVLDLLQLYRQQYPNSTAQIQTKEENIDLDFLTDDVFKILSSMRTGTQRIRQIVLSLRNFSRLDEAEKKKVNLHEGIDNTLLILNHQFVKTNITLIKEYGNLPPVMCYPAQLNQVFMNILNNAIDALKEQASPKIITIRTEVETEDWVKMYYDTPPPTWENLPNHSSQTLAVLRPATPAENVMRMPMNNSQSVVIRIRDNGPGIPLEIKHKIFDPFFTTKPIGQGTGLGLSISYQIVKKHGGKIEVNSQSAQGTEFAISLPLTCL